MAELRNFCFLADTEWVGYNIFTVPADIEITRGFREVKETTIHTCILLHTVVQSQDTDKGGVMVYGATELTCTSYL